MKVLLVRGKRRSSGDSEVKTRTLDQQKHALLRATKMFPLSDNDKGTDYLMSNVKTLTFKCNGK